MAEIRGRVPAPAPCDPEACFHAQAQCLRAFDPPKTLHKSNTGPRGAPREPEGGLGGPGVGKGGSKLLKIGSPDAAYQSDIVVYF